MLKNREPFAYVRFGDGEIAAMQRDNFKYSERRGGASVDKELKERLITAISWKHNNYWKGIMQPDMYPELWKWLKEQDYWNKDYEYLTEAWLIHNKGLLNFYEKFPQAVKKRRVYWVSGEDQDVRGLDFDIKLHIKIQGQFSWDNYEEIRTMGKYFQEDDVVCLSCGPLSRVLAYEWFWDNDKITILDLGSIYDPITRNNYENYHKKWDIK